MLRVDINDKRFTAAENPHGVSGAETIFHYWLDGSLVTGEYSGGRIRAGRLVGRVTSPDTIELLFQCVTTEDTLRAGRSSGHVARNGAGRATLSFEWEWLTGDRSGGTSKYVELRDAEARDQEVHR
jgi:hypothetical protein